MEAVLKSAEEGRVDEARQLAEKSQDFVVRTVGFALQYDHESFGNAMLRGARRELAGLSLAQAHAFLDHADPKIGSTVTGSPSVLKAW